MFSTTEISDNEKHNLIEKYLLALERWHQSDLINTKIKYALKLMKFNAALEYEEIHLRYSLYDSIYSIEHLGLSPDQTLKEEYETILNEFIHKREFKRCRLVAQDKVEDWKKAWEWYRL